MRSGFIRTSRTTPSLGLPVFHLVLPIVLLLCLSSSDVAGQANGRGEVYKVHVVPLLTKYCAECHEGDDAEAGWQVEKFPHIESLLSAREQWGKVLLKLRTSEMPPAESAQPTEQERRALSLWIDGTLNNIDCGREGRAGHVTIRRLNRHEYRNTIRDLLGVDYAPAEDFPADDVGYGFDNIGDVLTLPPILLEKYLTAAEEIAAQVIVTASRGPKIAARKNGADFSGNIRPFGPISGAGTIVSNAEVKATIKVAESGKYEIRVRACETHAGNEFTRMGLRVDGREVGAFEVRASVDEPQEYSAEKRLAVGDHEFGISFLNDYYNANASDPKQRDRNLIVVGLELVGPISSTDDDLPAMHRQIVFVTPNEMLSADDAARKVFQRIASRAFRRPATDDEIERLAALSAGAREAGDSFEASIQMGLQAILVSPHFLYRVEDPVPPSAQERTLTEFELASRLSYFLWSSMPDEELLHLAWRGQLRNADNLERQVRRMLNDPRSIAMAENFAGQWLQLRKFDEVNISKRHFPGFTDQLRADMRQETERFFTYVMRADRSVLELLSADYSFLNERLARHYGIAGVKGDEFQKVSLASSQRGGLLTQGSVLVVTSNPTRTSPVKRGRWILDNLLGEPPPDPPANVPELDANEGKELTGSLRQRMEQHRTNPACSSCHQRMDALGFALENFDAIGGWRSFDGKYAIEPTGNLPGGKQFSGPRELMQVLVETKRDAFIRCLSEKMLTYALGRGLEYYDKCTTDDVIKALQTSDHRFSAMITAIVNSKPFQHQGLRTQGP